MILMRFAVFVVLLYLIILPLAASAQPAYPSRLKATQWVNDFHLLEVINDTLLAVQPSGMDTTKYWVHNDTLAIFYDVQNIRNDNRWRQRDQGWIYFRIVNVNDDSLSIRTLKTDNQMHRFVLGTNDPAQIITLFNIDRLKVPITSFRELNVEQTTYVTSGGTTDTSGKTIYADTTWSVKRLELRPRKITVYNGLKKTTWPDSTDVDSYEQTRQATQRISRKDFLKVRKELSRVAWLLKSNPVHPRYLFMTFTGEINDQPVNVTVGNIHPLLYQFVDNLGRYVTK